MKNNKNIYQSTKNNFIIFFVLIILTIMIQHLKNFLSDESYKNNLEENNIANSLQRLDEYYFTSHKLYLQSLLDEINTINLVDNSSIKYIIADTSTSPNYIKTISDTFLNSNSLEGYLFIQDIIQMKSTNSDFYLDGSHYHSVNIFDENILKIVLISQHSFLEMYKAELERFIGNDEFLKENISIKYKNIVINEEKVLQNNKNFLFINSNNWSVYKNFTQYDIHNMSVLNYIIALLLFLLSVVLISLFKQFKTFKETVADISNLEEAIDKRTYDLWSNVRILEGSLAEEEMSKKTTDQANKELKQNILDLRRTQRQLIEAEKMAALGNLVAGVAHEINTPIGSSLTSVSYMEAKLTEFEKKLNNGTLTKRNLVTYIEKAKEANSISLFSLSRAAELVKSFKRIAVDRTTEILTTFSVIDYSETVLTSLKHEIKHFDVEIHLAGDKNLTIKSYPGAFFQIVSNLIMNSHIHGFKNNKVGNIWISFEIVNDFLRLTYSDDGNGIPTENHKKVFEPFFSTNRGGGGTGLGLNIIYNIINQQLYGDITLLNNPGGGVKFIINIPSNATEK